MEQLFSLDHNGHDIIWATERGGYTDLAGWLQDRKKRYLEDGWEEFDAEDFKTKQAVEKQRRMEQKAHELKAGKPGLVVVVGIALVTVIGLVSLRK